MSSFKRLKLFKKDPHCHWCGIEVINNYPEGTTYKKIPDNFATIDHIESRLVFGENRDNNNVVLACYKCNQERNSKEWKQIVKVGAEALRNQKPLPVNIEKSMSNSQFLFLLGIALVVFGTSGNAVLVGWFIMGFASPDVSK